jgi:ech hydrogenase subunit D
MGEPQEVTSVPTCDLVGIVAERFAEGYRLVQVGCSTLADAYEITYSFDRDYRFRSVRITVRPGEAVPSISVIYPNAFLYENEIHDLFGVPITHIGVDYRGTLYRTSVEAPFSVEQVRLPEPPKQKPAAAGKPEAEKKPADVPGEQTG